MGPKCSLLSSVTTSIAVAINVITGELEIKQQRKMRRKSGLVARSNKNYNSKQVQKVDSWVNKKQGGYGDKQENKSLD